MYGGFLLFSMRLLGLITPSELRALGHPPPSSFAHSAHNFLILVTIGGSLAYAEIATYEATIIKSKGKMVAYLVMTGLAKIWGAFAFFFLVIRNIILHNSYSTLEPIFNGAIHFEMERFRGEKRFKWFISIFLYVSFSVRVLSVVNNYLNDFEVWIFLDSVSFVLPNVYVMLFVTKFIFLVRMVRFNFQTANRFLKRNIIEMQRRYCTAPKDELDLILKLQWKTYRFLDLLNNRFGTELTVVMTYIYLGILRNLYDASIASALFSIEGPDIPALAIGLFKAGQEIVMSMIVFGNGCDLTEETKHTQALVWNAVPNVQCVNSKTKHGTKLLQKTCKTRMEIFILEDTNSTPPKRDYKATFVLVDTEEKLRSYLTSFIIRVSQLPSDVTANKIFKLNMKTFCNIITSVATQLVILISMGNQ